MLILILPNFETLLDSIPEFQLKIDCCPYLCSRFNFADEFEAIFWLNKTVFNSKASILMDSPILPLIIALLFAFTVESQRIPDRQPPESPSPPSPPPPSLVSPPPPPSLHHPPPPPRKRPAHKLNRHLGPPPQKGKTNRGKKIGLVFVGVASLLQVCTVAFLLISRRQLLKAQNGYQRN